MWWLKVLSFFTGGGLQSIIGSATDAYKAKLDAGENTDKLAADLAARKLQLDARDADLQAKLTASGTFGPRELMGYGVAVYIVKILVWDKCFHMGTTDPLDTNMWWVVTTIIIAYFGARAVTDLIKWR